MTLMNWNWVYNQLHNPKGCGFESHLDTSSTPNQHRPTDKFKDPFLFSIHLNRALSHVSSISSIYLISRRQNCPTGRVLHHSIFLQTGQVFLLFEWHIYELKINSDFFFISKERIGKGGREMPRGRVYLIQISLANWNFYTCKMSKYMSKESREDWIKLRPLDRWHVFSESRRDHRA